MTLAARTRIGIIGAGAWGTALATVAARAGGGWPPPEEGQRERPSPEHLAEHPEDSTGQETRRSPAPPLLWAREAEIAAAIARDGENPLYLPGVALAGIEATNDLAAAIDADLLILAVPSQHVREIAMEIARLEPPPVPVVIAAKGLEAASGLFMEEVVAESLPGHPLAILSGPTFADEVARGQPTAVTIAARDAALARHIARHLGSARFRPYVSDDVVGAETGGAVKNIIAIACGIVMGRGLGDNARAALITRGLAEMTRLAIAAGGRAETLSGLSGLGDLILTCTGTRSRNLSLGLGLGEGRSVGEILAQRRQVTEGVHSAAPVVARAARLGVEMPIAGAIDRILNHGAEIGETIAAMLARPFREEVHFTPAAP